MRLIDAFYAGQRAFWRHFKPATRGVKVMLFDHQGRILLIRNAYGDTKWFLLPGGGVAVWEDPQSAAQREIREELGCSITDLHLINVFYSEREGKRDTISLFRGNIVGEPIADGKEVAEARFFALNQMPNDLSPATARRIAEYLGQTEHSIRW